MDWRLFSLSGIDSSEKLKILRKKINWKDVNERSEFLSQFCDLIRDWKGELPDLRDIFRSEEIDWLLTKSIMQKWQQKYDLINFVIRCGYKDEPEIDRKGRPILRRNTPIHFAAIYNHHHEVIHDLFKIYDRFDVNYRDNHDSTHFLIACQYGFYKVAKKFLELGKVDLEYINPISGSSPLHMALNCGRKKTFELLLRSGADPNLANRAGSTPLHILCAKKRKDDRWDDCDDDSEDGSDDYMADWLNKFFMINDEKHQLVQIDARDNKGNTPLQLAVKNLSLKMVGEGPNYYKLRVASRVLAIVERLEGRGYQLGVNASNVAAIFVEYKLFQKSPTVRQRWRNDEDFAEKAKKIILKPSELSLYDFFELPRKEAEKLFAYTDYYNFWRSKILSGLDREHKITCVDDMCEIMSRGFFRRWALDSFVELTQHRLVLDCCEMIIDKLTNEELLNVCLAAADQSSKSP